MAIIGLVGPPGLSPRAKRLQDQAGEPVFETLDTRLRGYDGQGGFFPQVSL